MTREDRDTVLQMTGPVSQANLQITEEPHRKKPIAILALCALLLGALAGTAYVFLDDEPVIRKAVRTQKPAEKTTGQAHVAPKTALPQAPEQGERTIKDAAKVPTPNQDPVADANAVRLPAITNFDPGTVYSGTLGEITRLQAGSQIARADLALAEVQVKLKEMERRLAGASPEAESASDSLEDSIRESISSSLRDTLKATVQEEMARAMGSISKARLGNLRVIAVRGRGASLEAEVAGPEGRLFVREGSAIGDKIVDEISRTRVVVGGTALPWR